MQDNKQFYQELETLISDVYRKYIDSFSESEREECEMYLYEQGEYEEAWRVLTFLIEDKGIKLDPESSGKILLAKKVMGLD